MPAVARRLGRGARAAVAAAPAREPDLNKKLIELDSLRALMAFSVFVSHEQFLSGTEIWYF